MIYFRFFIITISIIFIMTTTMASILNEYVPLRATIQNTNNGKAKIGCVAFSAKLKHQYVLHVWS